MRINGMGRIIGLILIGAGVVAGLAVGAWLAVNYAAGDLGAGGAVLGVVAVLLVLVLPLVGVGTYFLWQGQQEARRDVDRRRRRRLLDAVSAQGQVAISDLAIELDVGRQEAQNILYDVVGMGLFNGYINWDEGMLYSVEARNLRELKQCRVCQGELELAGKGVVRCPYCDTEYFLDQPQVRRTA
jgi:hypothetical protein